MAFLLYIKFILSCKSIGKIKTEKTACKLFSVYMFNIAFHLQYNAIFECIEKLMPKVLLLCAQRTLAVPVKISKNFLNTSRI